jgi:hypothetical protein
LVEGALLSPLSPLQPCLGFPVRLKGLGEKAVELLKEALPARLIVIFQHISEERNNLPQLVLWKLGSGLHLVGTFECFRGQGMRSQHRNPEASLDRDFKKIKTANAHDIQNHDIVPL